MILHVDGVGIVMSAHVWSSAFVLMRIQTFHDTHGLLITHCFPLRQFYTWTPFLVVIAHVFIQPVPTVNLGNYNFPSRNNFLL